MANNEFNITSNKVSVQPPWMCKLIQVFAGCLCHKTGFPVMWLISLIYYSNYFWHRNTQQSQNMYTHNHCSNDNVENELEKKKIIKTEIKNMIDLHIRTGTF